MIMNKCTSALCKLSSTEVKEQLSCRRSRGRSGIGSFIARRIVVGCPLELEVEGGTEGSLLCWRVIRKVMSRSLTIIFIAQIHYSTPNFSDGASDGMIIVQPYLRGSGGL